MWIVLFLAIYFIIVIIGERGNVERVIEKIGEPIERIVETMSGWASLVKTSFSDEKEFLRTVRTHASTKDWDVNIPLAMASIEVKWGKSCYFHNLFNKTTYSNDPRLYFQYPTVANLKFKKYNSFADSVADFWDDIKDSSLYPNAYALRHNASECIRHLIDRGYAGSMRDPSRYLTALYRIQGLVF